MLRRYRAILLAGAVAVVIAGGISVATFIAHGDDAKTTGAVALPTACDNLVAAAEAIARPAEPSDASRAHDPLTPDPVAGRHETFKTLVEACEAEHAAARSE